MIGAWLEELAAGEWDDYAVPIPFFSSVTSSPFGHVLSRLALVSTKGSSPLSSAALLGWCPMLHSGPNAEDQITLSSHPTRAYGLGVSICNGRGGGFWRTTFEIFGTGSRERKPGVPAFAVELQSFGVIRLLSNVGFLLSLMCPPSTSPLTSSHHWCGGKVQISGIPRRPCPSS